MLERLLVYFISVYRLKAKPPTDTRESPLSPEQHRRSVAIVVVREHRVVLAGIEADEAKDLKPELEREAQEGSERGHDDRGNVIDCALLKSRKSCQRPTYSFYLTCGEGERWRLDNHSLSSMVLLFTMSACHTDAS